MKIGLQASAMLLPLILLGGCNASQTATSNEAVANEAGANAAAGDEARSPEGKRYLNQPLVSEIFTADPSAHVFNGKLYVYPSHDIDAGIPDDDLGNQYAMKDYRVLSMDRPGGEVTIHPVAIDVSQIPWASKQTWAPDAAYKNGTYYLYMPARDKDDVFRIGVATSKSPTGPFVAEPMPIPGAYSIDPAVFTDDDNESYMFFGGIWGGQLQRWANGSYNAQGGDTDLKQDDKPALAPKIARMSADMKTFAEKPRDVQIVDAEGKPILGGDHERRFFEAAWMFKRDGKYYFTYSTGDTHYLAYAIGDNPYGPFTYTGRIMEPVQGWTTHHSIVKFEDKWWLFYHDTQLSNKNHLRSVKMTEMTFNPDGTIVPINPFKD
ncbi:glycoside hydrolase family 43 protein [Sphingomonas sp. S1-29]|uniref:glycoside hydrolase family 43 protein n=1 Tax=Sphingomonas sp. S1-29 TaxID=2991074 RepID=UPI00223F6518|nr:glycoside hydrolase family 43 protein [Sphingomonas sp. S1-29]UZK70259.1 glycoside hydrolase family 43 protein [Sphingomonas sp. S1-29]